MVREESFRMREACSDFPCASMIFGTANFNFEKGQRLRQTIVDLARQARPLARDGAGLDLR